MPCWGSGNVARKRRSKLDIQSLKNCITTLEKVRDAHCGQLDTSTLEELNQVIDGMRIAAQEQELKVDPDISILCQRYLEVFANVLSIVTNIKDFLG